MPHKWQLKHEAIPFELKAGHLDHDLQCPNSTGGDSRIIEDDLKKPRTQVWLGKDLSFSESLHSKQASSEFLV
jgi:hypothetical protein